MWYCGSVRMHQPWELHRVRCTTRSTHPMSWYRRSSTASPCTRIIWCHLVGWYVLQNIIVIEWHRSDGTLIEWERVVQLYIHLPVPKHFDHTELIDRLECWDAFTFTFTFNSVLKGKLKFEFTVQSSHLAFHIAEHEYQPIIPSNHWNADVLYRSTVDGRGIVNDHCGEQVVVLVGNLQIGGLDNG